MSLNIQSSRDSMPLLPHLFRAPGRLPPVPRAVRRRHRRQLEPASSPKAASILLSIGDGPNCETIRLASFRCRMAGSPFSLGFVEQAEDHFTSADVMAVRIKSRVLAHLFQ
jgi:hypothetical protein